MEQSPTTSIEQELSSSTISHDSSEKSLNKIHKLDKWCRIAKRIVQFFRYIKIPVLRLRFIDMLNHISGHDFVIEELKNYETKKIQEDFAFLDDIKRYQEVFNTFLSFGFVWQDKEFRLAKLKANYIYDHYMSTSEAIAKTNIPIETIPFISNRINSPRIFSSLIYLNLFNDAEKFIIEKLLMIYMRIGLNGVSTLNERSIIHRYKANRIHNESISPSEHLKEINLDFSDVKLKIEPQYDEIIIPNWTYSMGSGIVYNPIREKCLKITKKTTQKKTKTADTSDNSMIKLNNNTSNEMHQLDSAFLKSKFPARINRHLCSNSIHFNSIDKSLPKSNSLSTSPYSRCDHIVNKNMFDKRRILQEMFICKVHSSPGSEPNRFIIKNKIPYRMAFLPSTTDLLHKMKPTCFENK